MANKLYLEENYVIWEIDGTPTGEYSKNHCVYRETATSFIIKEEIDNGVANILKADLDAGNWLDELDAPYTVASLRTWLRVNSGFKTAGGGSSAYLLDLYNSEGAYSMRKISSTATNCIRVRRSNDNAEQDIGFVGDDLDTTSLLSFVGANDGFVTTWYDQSGNGRDAFNGFATPQPRIVLGGVLETKNTKPAIYFNDDWVKYSGQVVPLATNPFSYFTVSSHETANDSAIVFKTRDIKQSSGGTYVLNWHDRSTFELNFQIRASTAYFANLSVQRDNSDYKLLSGFVDSSNNMSAFDNGATGTTNTYSGTYTSDVLMIGDSTTGSGVNQLVGHIGEVIILNTDESANRTAIETDINNYYSVY